jgi:hypothetical protein
MTRTAKYHKTVLFLIPLLLAAPAAVAEVLPGSSIASDSLTIPGEVYTVGAEYVRRLNINTFDDILEIIPGVSFWREGPPNSATGFSVAGRRASLMINARPADNIYTSEPLVKFIDPGRLVRVEVARSGVSAITGEPATEAVINLVVERGGREYPFTQADFTYGESNRRARRIWFATPQSYVTASISYNEYLQDAIESLDFGQNRLIGNDHLRSVSFELCLGRDREVVVQFRNFEESFNSTACERSEDIRSSGFDSRIDYTRGRFRGSIRHRGYERLRQYGRMTGLCSGFSGEYTRSYERFDVRGFLKGREYLFENRFSGVESDPHLSNYSGGLTFFSKAAEKYPLRGSILMGSHSELESYLGWEVAAAREGEKSYQSVSFSRRVQLPSPSLLFHPVSILSDPECYDVLEAGSRNLSSSLVEELSVRSSFGIGVVLEVFHRRIHDPVKSGYPGGGVYNADDTGELSGALIRLRRELAWNRFVLEADAGGEYLFVSGYPEEGVPEYRGVGNLYIRFPLFRKTEIMTLHLNSIIYGRREWRGELTGRAAVHNFSLSMTLMSALIRFQYKNLTDTQYQTVPGYYMAERHFRIGILWDLPN